MPMIFSHHESIILLLLLLLITINSINTLKSSLSIIKSYNTYLYCNGIPSISSSMPSSMSSSITVLTNYNNEYLSRNKKGRILGKNPKIVELERVQELKADGIKKEREELRNAVDNICRNSDEITLGIMAGTGIRAIACLRAWVSGLELSRGILRAVDENNNEVEVFLLYNQT
jgi:hypothetical protein